MSTFLPRVPPSTEGFPVRPSFTVSTPNVGLGPERSSECGLVWMSVVCCLLCTYMLQGEGFVLSKGPNTTPFWSSRVSLLTRSTGLSEV